MLPVAVGIPALGGLGVLVFGRRPNVRDGISLLAGIAVAAVVLSLWWLPESVQPEFGFWTWLPQLSLGLRLEPLGLLFATISAVLWPITTLYTIGYLRGNAESNQTRFGFFFALSIAAAQLIAFSGDLVTLFLGYELLTLATYALVAHSGTSRARRGARTYLSLLLLTSIGFLLPAIVATGLLAGSLRFPATASDGALLAGQASAGVLTGLYVLYLFGIGKAALMPFHRWLPAAMVAPTPVSALLHAVAVVKAGVFAVLKVTVYVFGVDQLSAEGLSTPMMWVAAITLLAASLYAMTRDDFKARLAYSTVSQLAYIVLAATLASNLAVVGGALHIAAHAVGKITLFFCAGVVYTVAHRERVSELDGLGRAMPWTFTAFTVAAVSVIGLPPLGGSWSKWLLYQGAADAQQTVLLVVLMVGSVLTAGYLLPITVRAFFRMPAQPIEHRDGGFALVFPPVLTAAATIALFFGAEALIAPLAEAVGVSSEVGSG